MTQGKDGSKIMASFGLGAKNKQLVQCRIDPDNFKKDILEDEAKTSHADHNTEKDAKKFLIQKYDENLFENVSEKAQKKWLIKNGYSKKFWWHVAKKINTDEDQGVYAFARVETVAKDVTKPNEASGWRLVWKSASQIEKTFDLFKSYTMRSDLMNNDAYAPGRSTQRTLMKVSCWEIRPGSGLLGCDYQNAFGNACRQCTNDVLGCKFITDEIHFKVITAAGTSENGVSVSGTGAGRSSGGPGFNSILEHHLTTDEFTREKQKKIAPYADDSLVILFLGLLAIRAWIDAFQRGDKFGLFMHKKGKKGPTILCHQNDQDSVRNLVKQIDDVDVNVVDRVKFLGVNVKLCESKNVMVAEFLPKTTSSLSFFATELNRTTKMMHRMGNLESLNRCMDTMSQSVASVFESRIQYAIAFLDKKSLIKAINLHKRVICSMSGSYFRYFGFKNHDEIGEDFFDDLFGFIDLRTSETYTRLCRALGRPTMLQMAFRAVTVLVEQGNIEQLTKEYDAWYRANHMKTTAYRTRVTYLKTLTNTLLSDHMDSKGWDNKTPGCRFDGCSSTAENLQHVLSHMGVNMASKSAQKCIQKSVNAEKRMKRGARINYDIVRLNASAAEFIAEEISGQKVPKFKIRKKDKDASKKRENCANSGSESECEPARRRQKRREK